jgi:hypothetical protein
VNDFLHWFKFRRSVGFVVFVSIFIFVNVFLALIMRMYMPLFAWQTGKKIKEQMFLAKDLRRADFGSGFAELLFVRVVLPGSGDLTSCFMSLLGYTGVPSTPGRPQPAR